MKCDICDQDYTLDISFERKEFLCEDFKEMLEEKDNQEEVVAICYNCKGTDAKTKLGRDLTRDEAINIMTECLKIPNVGNEKRDCDVCGNKETTDYAPATIDRDWSYDNIKSNRLGAPTIYLCKNCKEKEAEFDAQR